MLTVNKSILYMGLDVHKKSITIVGYKDYENNPSIIIVKPNNKQVIKKYFMTLKQQGFVICCYEAGPTGFELYRFLSTINIQCVVAAPGLIPKKRGKRIKNDSRDANDLAKALRNGDIVSIYVPTRSDEAVRDYIRMRDDFKSDLRKKKQQLLHLLLRHDIKYDDESKYWTLKHRQWIKSLNLKNDFLNETLNEYYISIVDIEDKIKRMEEQIKSIAMQPNYSEKANHLRCLKGIDYLTALSFIVEVGDFRRFNKAEQFMGFLGLTPCEKTSGERRRQGGITKCGNTHLRKLLIESSWHYRYYKASSIRLTRKRKGQSSEIISYADKAGRRLNKKYLKITNRGKSSKIAVTAVARELSGFIWGIMTNNI